MSPLREALAKAREEVCVPQRGENCHGYGGMKCDKECSAFQAGIERRREAHENFLTNRITECTLPNGCTLRISAKGSAVLLEIGEYVNDGNVPIMFTVFEHYTIPRIVFEALRHTLTT